MTNLEENRFYGCYQGTNEKSYKFQCKEFLNEHTAHEYIKLRKMKHFVFMINKNHPKMFDKVIIEKYIKDNLYGVDII